MKTYKVDLLTEKGPITVIVKEDEVKKVEKEIKEKYKNFFTICSTEIKPENLQTT